MKKGDSKPERKKAKKAGPKSAAEDIAGPAFETRAVHEAEDPSENQGAIIPPIFLSSTYELLGLGEFRKYDYARSGNPTRTMLERKVSSLEGGRFGLAFASGMAAENAILSMLRSMDHVVCEQNVYGGTHRLLTKVFPRYNVDVTFVDATDPSGAERAFRKGTKLLWIETPTNPRLKVLDIKALAGLAHRRGALLVVDNTFSSPYLQRPLAMGADIVVHSSTKFIGGHSDLVGGIVVTSDERAFKEMAFYQNAAGAVPSPFDCWLAVRSLKTLALRMREHCANARKVAEFLAIDQRIKRVHYPGLADHPQHTLARRQMADFGGIISFEIDGDMAATKRFVSELRYFTLAVSLGAVESLVAHPATMTHASLTPEERKKADIPDNLVRISVGVEKASDLIADLDGALRRALGRRGP